MADQEGCIPAQDDRIAITLSEPNNSTSNEPPSVEELRHVVDQGSLLAGEVPQSTYRDDAMHWVQVYGELLSVKLALIEQMERLVSGVTHEEGIQEAAVDARVLRAQADRYRLRLAYWTQRSRQLAESFEQGRHDTEGPAG